jgi:plasmid stability protein
MPSVQIKDVPDEVHAVLRRRAAAEGRSLQEYLLTRLVADAARPTLAEVVERIEHRSGGSLPLPTAALLTRR